MLMIMTKTNRKSGIDKFLSTQFSRRFGAEKRYKASY